MEGKGSKPAEESLDTSADRVVDEITVKAHERVNQVLETAGPAVDRMASNAHVAIETVAGVAATAVDTLSVRGEQLTNAPAKVVEAVRDYTRQQPIAALGIALAAGWILGRLTR